jgi:MoxR-like ATPase
MSKQTKLTLRLERDLIERAKKIARRRGKSVSKMVADYFRALDTVDKEDQDVAVGPLTRSLQGILRDSGLDERDHRRHLEEKHG